MTGHIRRRGAQTWELKFDVGRDLATGRRLTRYHAFKGTKRAAELELAKLITATATGEYADPSKLTVAEFLSRWESDWAPSNVSAKTFGKHLSDTRNCSRTMCDRISALPVFKG